METGFKKVQSNVKIGPGTVNLKPSRRGKSSHCRLCQKALLTHGGQKQPSSSQGSHTLRQSQKLLMMIYWWAAGLFGWDSGNERGGNRAVTDDGENKMNHQLLIVNFLPLHELLFCYAATIIYLCFHLMGIVTTSFTSSGAGWRMLLTPRAETTASCSITSSQCVMELWEKYRCAC